MLSTNPFYTLVLLGTLFSHVKGQDICSQPCIQQLNQGQVNIQSALRTEGVELTRLNSTVYSYIATAPAAGPTGPTGPKGPTGPAGNIGALGPAGPPGALGGMGSMGAAGPIGITGALGPLGPTGSQGYEGPEGSIGTTGLKGSDGPPGSMGPTGVIGPSGDDGPIGSPGPQGPLGLTPETDPTFSNYLQSQLTRGTLYYILIGMRNLILGLNGSCNSAPLGKRAQYYEAYNAQLAKRRLMKRDYNDYIGEILLGGFNFCPIGFLPCDGSLQSISQYSPLFALIGTTYGGDGISLFGLPNLSGQKIQCMTWCIAVQGIFPSMN